MKKAFVDLDGTLLNSKLRHKAVLEKASEKNGCQINSDNYLAEKENGKTTEEYLKEFSGLDTETINNICCSWQDDIEKEEYLVLDSFYDDAERFLSEIVRLGYRVIIITARNNALYVQSLSEKSFLKKYIDEIIAVPAENAALNKETEAKKIYTDNSIVIGDTEADYLFAGRLGMKSYILNRGFRNKSYLGSIGIKSFDNLDCICNEIRRAYENDRITFGNCTGL